MHASPEDGIQDPDEEADDGEDDQFGDFPDDFNEDEADSDALLDGDPRAAIDTGQVDWCATVHLQPSPRHAST